jgi:glycine betaine/proline transport system permease protein
VSIEFSIGQTVESVVTWLNINLSGLFDLFSLITEEPVFVIQELILLPPVYVTILIFGVIGWYTGGIRIGFLTIIGLAFCYFMDLWNPTAQTMALVIVSVFLSLLIALPFGILSAYNRIVDRITRPLMDFMQTMPQWVYLVPAVILFRMGKAPAVFATAVVAVPPALRLTNLAIRMVPEDHVELGRSFGAKTLQILFKIQIPAGLPTIMAGVNQCVMLALSMAVLAGLIGAGGLGGEVTRGLTRMMTGVAVRAGIGIVFLAVVFDRILHGAVERLKRMSQRRSKVVSSPT